MDLKALTDKLLDAFLLGATAGVTSGVISYAFGKSISSVLKFFNIITK